MGDESRCPETHGISALDAERLRELEQLVNRSPVMVFLWRIAEGWPVEFVSDNVAQLGYTAADLMSGRVSWVGITHPEDVPRLEAEVRRLLDEGVEEFSQEYRLLTKSGDVRWIRDRNRVCTDRTGTPSHIQSILLDVTEQKEAEAALRRSEEKYRLLVERSGEGICLIQDAEVKFANASLGRMLGTTADALVGRRLADLLHPEHVEPVFARRERILSREVTAARFETVLRCPDGGDVPVEASVNTTDYTGRLAVLVFVRDITERKEAEAAERARDEEERRFNRQLAELHTVTMELSMAGSVDDLCRRAVELGRSRLGFDRLGLWLLVGRPIVVRGTFGIDEAGRFRDERDVRGPVDPDSMMGQVLVHRPPLAICEDIDLLDQHGRPVGRGTMAIASLWDGREVIGCMCADNLLSGAPFTENRRRLAGLYADALGHLCSRQRAAEALAASERRFRELAELLPEVVCETDAAGRLTFANQNAFRTFGYAPDDLRRGLNIIDMVRPDDRDRARRHLESTLGGQTVRHQEYVAVRKDGSTLPVLVYSSPILRDGSPAGARVTVVDITDRKRLEQQLRQAQKMEAIGQLAGGIAHDFNNLLAGILGFANIHKLEVPAGSDIAEAFETIEQTAERAAELTRQLLDFARTGTRKLAPVDLHRVLRDAVSLLDRTVDKRIRFSLHLQPDDVTVEGDAAQLQQVFLNLAVNARDAMPDGGELILRTEPVELGPDDCRAHRGMAPGPHVRVTVSDTGCGIPEHLAHRVFEPFFTTKQPGSGSGMGLAMVYGIIQSHGGRIRLDSRVGEGTTFLIDLPLAGAAQREPEPVGGEPVRGTGRVLVVDDEPVVRNAASAMLRELGYTPIAVASGREAVETYRRRGDEIALVLIDMVMPEMDGGECFRALKAIDPGVRAVLTTGYGRAGRAQAALDEGMVGFAQKPYNLAAFSRILADALRARIDRPSDADDAS
jgi:PAS domain S-box-containing protein